MTTNPPHSPSDQTAVVAAAVPGSAALADGSADALLAELDKASRAHAEAMRPPNTKRSYAGDWKTWERFIAEKNTAGFPIPLTAATVGTLSAFVSWLWDAGAAPATITRRVTGVAVTLRTDHGVEADRGAVAAARQLIRDYVREAAAARQAPRGRGQAAALVLDDLRKMSAACPDTVAGLRDRALILMAFAIAGRRTEVAGLMAADIAEDPNGLVVDVRVSKTRPRTVAVPYGSNPLTCPVRAWQAWKTSAELGPDDAAFLRIDRHGVIGGPMSGEAAGDILTRAADRAGVAARLTGHSARAGLATEARRAGKDRTAIAAVTGHAPRSAELDRYFRTVDQWGADDNALIGIGL